MIAKAESANLDLLRTVAVSLVVLSHVLLILNGGEHPQYSLRAMGHIGVAIFFVHTTLVLMQSLERHGSAAVPFYVRRFFRIYPLAVAIVLLVAMLQLAAGVPADSRKVVSNLLLVHNITGHDPMPHPLWSLPYEVQMYLVLPILYQITATRSPVAWAATLCAALVLLMLVLPADSLAYKLLRFAPCFLPGLLAFVLAHRRRATTGPLVLFGMVFGCVLVVPLLVAAGLPEIPLLWAVCLAVGLTIPACRQITSKPLTRGAKLVATYSYGVYLTHVFALGPIDRLMQGSAFAPWAIVLVLLPGLAYICYHGIEKRGIALGARLADRMTGRTAIATG